MLISSTWRPLSMAYWLMEAASTNLIHSVTFLFSALSCRKLINGTLGHSLWANMLSCMTILLSRRMAISMLKLVLDLLIQTASKLVFNNSTTQAHQAMLHHNKMYLTTSPIQNHQVQHQIQDQLHQNQAQNQHHHLQTKIILCTSTWVSVLVFLSFASSFLAASLTERRAKPHSECSQKMTWVAWNKESSD